MNAAKAKRRWIKWCRYAASTGTKTDARWSGGYHAGQAKAYKDHMFAGRTAPQGVRRPYHPRWTWGV